MREKDSFGKWKPSTYVGQAQARSDEEARTILLRVIWECGGHSSRSARVLEMSRTNFHYHVGRLGLRGAMAKIRAYTAARFRGGRPEDLEIDPSLFVRGNPEK